MEPDGLLNDLIRARITSLEYDGIQREDIEKLFILEYGKLPPNFNVIDSSSLGVGQKSGFNGTVIHFHDENINEVYFFNRGTESDMNGLTDDLFNKLNHYRKSPEKLKEIVFDGNEDIYADIYTVLLGEDQSHTADNIDFADKVIQRIDDCNTDILPTYYLDGHSLGGSEGQNLMSVTDNLFTDVNVYNDAPSNVYNLILINDELRKKIQRKYGINVERKQDFKGIDIEELYAFLDKELGHYSDKITYYRNADDIMTNLTLPYEYRFINEFASNVKTFPGHKDAEMINVIEKYPMIAYTLISALERANKEDGIRGVDWLRLLAVNSVKHDSFSEFLNTLKAFQADYEKMKPHLGRGHSMNQLIENMAKVQGRIIKGNEEIFVFSDSNGNKTIKLNIEDAYSFYTRSLTTMLGKKNVIDNLIDDITYHTEQRYGRFYRKIRQEMDEIERFPHRFLSANDYYTYDAENIVKYKNLRFIEDPPPRIPQNITSTLERKIIDLQDETKRQGNFLEDFKAGIIKLVDTDERIALLFTSYPERKEAW